MRILTYLLAICMIFACDFVKAQGSGEREWSDSTGKFKITARLIEVKEGFAYLKSRDGKTIRIPVSRLSSSDQELLKSNSDSPFEAIDESEAKGGNALPGQISRESGAALGDFSWNTQPVVNWDEVEQLITQGTGDWQITLPESGKLPFQPKKAALQKKMHGWESMHPIAVNPNVKRAAVGYTASFTLPRPISRVAIVDLETGKAVHSEQLECNVRPLALLNDGSTILVAGAGRDDDTDSPDKLQIWRLNGKKIVKSGVWIPHPKEHEAWGKKANAAIRHAYPVKEDLVLTHAEHGMLVLWQLPQRKPVWYAKLGNNSAVAPNADRSLLAILDGTALMVVKSENGEVLASTQIPPNTHVAWPRLCWSPSGKKLIFTTASDVRPFDLVEGKWLPHFSLPTNGAPIASNVLSCPDEDFVLLNNQLLVHLPTKIQVCEYRDAGAIEVIGGTSFIGMIGDGGGLLAPGTFPHPEAKKMLEKAKDNPSLFLIHPGSLVSIDVNGCGQHQQEIRGHLEKAAKNSGYVVAAGAELILRASISGPKSESVSYIARGTYSVNAYSSNIKLMHGDQVLWEQSASNVPHMLMTRGDQTIEQALAEAGQKPNTGFFGQVRFPEYMQQPRTDNNAKNGNNNPGRPRTAALLSSRFTMQGIVDDK